MNHKVLTGIVLLVLCLAAIIAARPHPAIRAHCDIQRPAKVPEGWQVYRNEYEYWCVWYPLSLHLVDAEPRRVSFSPLDVRDPALASDAGLATMIVFRPVPTDEQSQLSRQSAEWESIGDEQVAHYTVLGGFAGERHEVYIFRNGALGVEYLAAASTSDTFRTMTESVRFD